MNLTPELVAAVAASAAAVLSGGTFFISGYREERKWRRDALLGAMVDFLDGSFARYSEAAFVERRAQYDRDALDDRGAYQRYPERAKSGHRKQNAALTHLRLLAPTSVVRAAEDLAAADRRVEQWFERPSDVPDQWDLLNGERQEYRRNFIGAYRREYRLGHGKSIEDGRQGPAPRG